MPSISELESKYNENRAHLFSEFAVLNKTRAKKICAGVFLLVSGLCLSAFVVTFLSQTGFNNPIATTGYFALFAITAGGAISSAIYFFVLACSEKRIKEKTLYTKYNIDQGEIIKKYMPLVRWTCFFYKGLTNNTVSGFTYNTVEVSFETLHTSFKEGKINEHTYVSSLQLSQLRRVYDLNFIIRSNSFLLDLLKS